MERVICILYSACPGGPLPQADQRLTTGLLTQLHLQCRAGWLFQIVVYARHVEKLKRDWLYHLWTDLQGDQPWNIMWHVAQSQLVLR